MARLLDAALKLIATGILGEGAGVGNCEQGDGEAHGAAATAQDARTASSASTGVLQVFLFASLRERAGWGERSLRWSSDCATPRAVWEQLGLGSLQGISIAVNQELVDADQALNAGDELAFLPPFTGG